MSAITLIGVLLLIVGIGLALVLRRQTAADSPGPIPLSITLDVCAPLTLNEQQFLGVLSQALPAPYTVLPQIPLGAFVTVKAETPQGQQAFWNKTDRKRVDVLIVERKTMIPRPVMELDDRTHRTPHRQQRDDFVDALCQRLRIPSVHVAATTQYTSQDVQAVPTTLQETGPHTTGPARSAPQAHSSLSGESLD